MGVISCSINKPILPVQCFTHSLCQSLSILNLLQSHPHPTPPPGDGEIDKGTIHVYTGVVVLTMKATWPEEIFITNSHVLCDFLSAQQGNMTDEKQQFKWKT